MPLGTPSPTLVLSACLLSWCVPADALLVAITRIGGIIGGVLITLVLAVVVFPKSASHEAADSMSAALQGLMQLYALAWSIDWSSDDALAHELRSRGSNGSNRYDLATGLSLTHGQKHISFLNNVLIHLRQKGWSSRVLLAFLHAQGAVLSTMCDI